MCGIYASVTENLAVLPSATLQACLCRRGPDHSGTFAVDKSDNVSRASLYFFSTVLSLRGGQVTSQPLVDPSSGSVLCWNGEAWKINGDEIGTRNDAEAILSCLVDAVAISSIAVSIQAVLDVLRSVSGPFAFFFYDKLHSLIYFGRDCLGRRSLLFNNGTIPGSIQISSVSVAPHDGWKEVEADGVYVVDCSKSLLMPVRAESVPSMSTPCGFPVFRMSWTVGDSASSKGLSLGNLNSSLPTVAQYLTSNSSSVLALEQQLVSSLKPRVLSIPDPMKFLKPEDARLAVLFSGGLDCTVLARMAHDLVPPYQSIDLLNVAFENPRVVQAAKKSQEVGFQSDQSSYEACPDRITGRNALEELKMSCPGRSWRFVEVNIPYSETLLHRKDVISLIYPHNTEMDLSIALALYFAARGTGLIRTDMSSDVLYTTTARVLLSGLGADELFGGYTRHGVAHSRHGFKGLIEELELDVNRLGKRNLGRDDRVLSNWGREARFPYLDEDLVRWALDCPVWEKCGFGSDNPDSMDDKDYVEPGKRILRLLAQKLGLPTVAKEKKRAIQFGARTAKMETGRTKGTTLVS